jgi:hypothetical protein
MRIEGWAGVIGTVTGVLALIVAALTAYLTIFQQVDDLKVAIGNAPSVGMKDGDLWIIGPLEITFINSGNRSVAITNAWTRATRLKSRDATPTNCDTPGSRQAAFKLNELILKPGEIELKKLEPEPLCFMGCDLKKGQDLFGLPTWIVPKSAIEGRIKLGDAFLTCLKLKVTTADGSAKEIDRLVFKYEIGQEKPIPLFDKEKPIVVVHNTTVVWWH